MVTSEPAEPEGSSTLGKAILTVGVVALSLFGLITVLDHTYHTTRHGRAEDRYRDGMKLAMSGKLGNAVEDFRAALVYEHDDPKYRFALAKALIGLGEREEAESHLQELLQRDPIDGPINLMLARLAESDGRDDEAMDDYNRAIYGRWPDKPEDNRISARLELVGVLEHHSREPEVLAELLALIGELPVNETATRRKVASLLLAHHSAQHAADTYRSILGSAPRDALAERGLGDAEFAMGDFVAARRAYLAARRYGATDAAIDRRIDVCDTILALDPSLVRLTANQRRDRAKELLSRTLAAASACTSVPTDVGIQAQQLLLRKATRGAPDDVASILAVAERLWEFHQDRCPKGPHSEEAIAAVMAKITKQ